jgi:hypothetical protein
MIFPLVLLVAIAGVILIARRAVDNESRDRPSERDSEPSTNSFLFPTPGASSSSTLFSNPSHQDNVGCADSHHGGCDVAEHGFDGSGHH